MAITGVLIAESLRTEARLEGVVLTVRRITRADDGDTDAGQPLTWTFIEFEAPLEQADRLPGPVDGTATGQRDYGSVAYHTGDDAGPTNERRVLHK